ncbi:MAG: DMT family transporter [Candidatus Saccharimonadales bacterium]
MSTLGLVGLGLLAASAWGVGDFLVAKCSRVYDVLRAAAVMNLVEGSIVITYLLLFQSSHFTFDSAGSLYTIAAGLFLAVALLFFFQSMRLGPVSITSPLGSMYPLITTILSVGIFGAHLTPRQYLAIALILVGVCLVSGVTTRRNLRLGKGPLAAVCTAIAWGAAFSLLSKAMSLQGWQSTTLLQYITLNLFFIGVCVYLHLGQKSSARSTEFKKMLQDKLIFGAVAFGVIGIGAFNYGIFASTASGGALISAVSASYPLLTVFLALKHFDETTTWLRTAGTLFGLAGVVLIALG